MKSELSHVKKICDVFSTLNFATASSDNKPGALLTSCPMPDLTLKSTFPPLNLLPEVGPSIPPGKQSSIRKATSNGVVLLCAHCFKGVYAAFASEAAMKHDWLLVDEA